MSPRQVQFVRLLEMTTPELEEEVQRQLDDNPALEALPSEAAAEPSSSADDYASEGGDPDDDPADRMAASQRASGADPGVWQIAADGPELIESLQEQLAQTECDDQQRQIASYIIGNIDQNGYLQRTLSAISDDLAINMGLDVPLSEVRRAFNIVRAMEPAGVGAVDLRDCLLLQIDRAGTSTQEAKIAREIVADYFDLLSKKHYDRLMSALGISDSKLLRRSLDYIRQLNPKPGGAVEPLGSVMRLSHISPDVIVEEDDNGRFTASVPNTLPQLQVEKSFAVDIPGESTSKQAREAMAFVRMKRDDAEAFISALRQRSSTLLDVTEAIVKRQPDFFRTGDKSKLRPMILKDISSDTGYDLSVISRATAGKYVETDMGIFPLKMFFNEAPSDASDTSSHQLMHAIEQIIANEDKRHPLSDQAILQALEEAGHKLARRTVTKYREKLGIPVGRLRRNL